MSAPPTHVATLRLELNGEPVAATVPTGTLLIDLLRDHFDLKGTKEGCGVGVCGQCTVLLDDAPVSACLLPAVLADGRSVWTIEALARRSPQAAALQAAFVAHEGLQCGICTAGQVVSASALLEQHPRPTDDQIQDWMAGNLCRCTGYQSIRRAIRAAAGEEVATDDAGL